MADHGYGDGTRGGAARPGPGPPWLAGRPDAGRPHSGPTVWRLLWLRAVCVRGSRGSQVLLACAALVGLSAWLVWGLSIYDVL